MPSISRNNQNVPALDILSITARGRGQAGESPFTFLLQRAPEGVFTRTPQTQLPTAESLAPRDQPALSDDRSPATEPVAGTAAPEREAPSAADDPPADDDSFQPVDQAASATNDEPSAEDAADSSAIVAAPPAANQSTTDDDEAADEQADPAAIAAVAPVSEEQEDAEPSAEELLDPAIVAELETVEESPTGNDATAGEAETGTANPLADGQASNAADAAPTTDDANSAGQQENGESGEHLTSAAPETAADGAAAEGVDGEGIANPLASDEEPAAANSVSGDVSQAQRQAPATDSANAAASTGEGAETASQAAVTGPAAQEGSAADAEAESGAGEGAAAGEESSESSDQERDQADDGERPRRRTERSSPSESRKYGANTPAALAERLAAGNPVPARVAAQAATGDGSIPAAPAATAEAPPVTGAANSTATPSAEAETTTPAATKQGTTTAPGNGSAPGSRLPLAMRGGERGASGPRITDSQQARLIQRVARAFQVAHAREGEIRLRLSPPELGAVRLEIKLQGSVMSARVEAETATARSLLLDNLGALRDRLAEQNIRIDQFDVDLRDSQSGGSPDGPRDQHDAQRQSGANHQERRSNRRSEGGESREPEAPTQPVAENGGLNVVV